MSATKTQLPAYKSYVAGMQQSGISDPTVVVNQNELSAAIVWTNTAAGEFTGTLSGAFTSNKTRGFVNLSGVATITGNVFTSSMEYIDANTIKIFTYLAGTPSSHSALKYDVEIRVYP